MFKCLNQSFPKRSNFSQLGGKNLQGLKGVRVKILNFWRWTYTRYSGVSDKEQKKVLATYISNFEIYIKYFEFADEKHKSKKS